MGTRFTGGFYSNHTNDEYDVYIDDSAFGGSSTAIKISHEPVLRYDGENQERLNPILAGSVSLPIQITNSTLETFITDLVSAAEERFILRIDRNSSLWWVGYILPDVGGYEDTTGFPYNYTIKATDGISRLKGIDYNNAGSSYTGRQTILEHLYNILGKIDLTSYWSDSDFYLRTHFNWIDQNQDTTGTPNQLAQTNVNHKIFIGIDTAGYVKYRPAYDVLKHFCQRFGCRFFFYGARWWFLQVPEFESDGKRTYNYDKDANLESTTTSVVFDKTVDNSAIHRLAGGQYTFYPPLKDMVIDYKHYDSRNWVAGQEWSNLSGSSFTGEDTVGTSNNTSRIAFTANIRMSSDVIPPDTMESHRYKFRLTVKVGSYYLRRVATFSGTNINYASTTWNTGGVSYYEFIGRVISTENSDYYDTINFISPPLEEAGTLEFNIEYVDALELDGDSLTIDIANTWIFFDNYLEVVTDGALENQSSVKRFEATNPTTSANTASIKLETIIGDGPSDSSIGRMQIYNGSTWEDSSGWRRGASGAYKDISTLLIEETMGGQLAPVRKVLGGFVGNFGAHNRLVYNSYNLLFSGGEFRMKTDTWNGEWFVISRDGTNINSISTSTTNADVDFPSQDPDTPQPPEMPPISSPTGNTNYIPVAPNNAQIQSIPSNVSPQPVATTTTTTAAIDSGATVDTISVPSIPSDYIYNVGDEITVTNPITGESQTFTVNTAAEASDTSIDVTNVAATIDIPIGSHVSIDIEALASQVYTPDLKDLNWMVFDAGTSTAAGTKAFFRVTNRYPVQMTGVSISAFAAGSGSSNLQISFKKDSSTTITTMTLSPSETYKSFGISSSHVDLVVGSLYEFDIDNVVIGTPHTGLIITLHCQGTRV